MASTSFVCGNNPYCLSGIYMKARDGLRYIGDIYTTGKTGLTDNFIHVEDNWSNGWRVLNNGRTRTCWLKKVDPKHHIGDYVMGFSHTPGQAGYFSGVDISEECPKEFPWSSEE